MSRSGMNLIGKRIILLIFFIRLLAVSEGSLAGVANKLISENREYAFNLNDFLILFDSHEKVSIEEVSKLPDSKFDFNYKNFNDNIHQSLWLKLNFTANEGLDEKWIFEMFNHRAAEIILFVEKEKGSFVAIDTIGLEIPFYERNLHHRFPAFQIPVEKGNNTIFIKYRSSSYLGLSAQMKPYQDFINYSNRYYFIIGGFYLVLFILVLYNFLFFLSTHDRIYLYYILFVLVSALECLKVDQIGFALLAPDYPAVNYFLDEYVRVFFVFGIINYGSYFLSIKKLFPKIHFAIWCIFALFAVTQSIIYYVYRGMPFALAISEIFIFSILSMLLYVAVKRLKQGYKPVRIFIIGFISIFIGFAVTYFFYNGWIKGNHFVYYSLFYGIGIDTFMFSFALSSRLRQERLEKERALISENEARQKMIGQMLENELLLNKVNRELEEKVEMRTRQLEESNRKLETQAEIIKQWNINLDKENWNLNKTIKSLKIRKVVPENLTFSQMRELFPSETECYTFLSEFKWQEGFSCKKCGNGKEAKLNDFYSRRCSKCGTIESITARTIFHKLKFPLDKAFYIAYAVFMRKENLNVSDLAREIDLNYKTCLKFKMKLEDAMESRKKEGIKIKSWEDLIFEN
jgi:hypothetical protein